MTETLKAPAIVHELAFTGTATEPAILNEASGTYSVVLTVLEPLTVAGIVFGSSADMDEATETSAFPVPSDIYRKFKVGPSTPYFSVIGLDGASGTLLYYIEGQTEV